MRPIKPSDNRVMADIIREVMTSYGLVGEGYSIMDPEVDNMYESYSGSGSFYWVVQSEQTVLGGGGYGPLVGAPPHVSEVKKMYFRPQLRGKGWGKKLLKTILSEIRQDGYRYAYLETVHELAGAIQLYKKFGFQPLAGPMGQTGHSACDMWLRNGTGIGQEV